MASGNTLYENHLDHLVEEANDIKAGGEDLMERGMDLKAGEVERPPGTMGGWLCGKSIDNGHFARFCGRKSCLVVSESMLDAIPLQVVRSSWVMCSHPSLMLKIYRLMRCGCRPVCEGPWRFFQVGKNMSVETCPNRVLPTLLVTVTKEGL